MAQVDHSPSLLVLFTAPRGFMVRSHFTCQPGSARLHPLWPRGPCSGCKCSSTTLFRARTWSLLPRRVGVETVVIGDSMPQMRGDTTVRQAMHLASEWNFCLTEPAQWHSRTTRRTFGQELPQAIRSPNRCDLAASGRRTTGSNSSEPLRACSQSCGTSSRKRARILLPSCASIPGLTIRINTYGSTGTSITGKVGIAASHGNHAMSLRAVSCLAVTGPPSC